MSPTDTITYLPVEGDEASTDAPSDAGWQGGTRFGDYELLERLASGAMGVVYKARRFAGDLVMALKVGRAGDGAALYTSEAEAAGRLRHPNIVQVYEMGRHDDRPFLAMEYCAGGSLADKLRAGPAARAKPPDWWGRWPKPRTPSTGRGLSTATSSRPTCS